ncbi:unnamed protein product [Anisakis simplex]|uniref:VWFA domain-containing protein n=1 Tax=Anisakis simplex TaxID=6269 RepID=A0A0M3JSA9_ANISI|nr:unnamed protein product [Anisakis simplex]
MCGCDQTECEISDILFVLDASGSIRGFYEHQKEYVAGIADKLNIDPNAQHVGLILYSSKYRKRLIIPLDQAPTKQEFLRTVQRLPFYSGITATGAALNLSISALEKRRVDKRTAVLVLTDGFSYDRVNEASDILNKLPNVLTVVAAIFQVSL